MNKGQVIKNLDFAIRAIDICYSRDKIYDSNKDFASGKRLGDTFESCFMNIYADYKGKNSSYENTHQITIGGKKQGFIKITDISDILFDEVPKEDFTFAPTANVNSIHLHLISYKNGENIAECYLYSMNEYGHKSDELKLCTLNKDNRLVFEKDVLNYYFERQNVGLDHDRTKNMGKRVEIDDSELLKSYGFKAKNIYKNTLGSDFDFDDEIQRCDNTDYCQEDDYPGKWTDDIIIEADYEHQTRLEDINPGYDEF